MFRRTDAFAALALTVFAAAFFGCSSKENGDKTAGVAGDTGNIPTPTPSPGPSDSGQTAPAQPPVTVPPTVPGPAAAAREFELTSPDTLLQFELKKNADDAAASKILNDISASAGFKTLSQSRQMSLLALLGGKNNDYSIPARAIYSRMNYTGLSQSAQIAAITQIVAPQGALVPSGAAPQATFVLDPKPTSQDLWPRQNGYKQTAGLLYQVTLTYPNGHTYKKGINFYNVQHQGIWFTAQQLAAKLAVLPEEYAVFVPTYRMSEWNDGTAGDTGSDGTVDLNATTLPEDLPNLIVHESTHSAWALLASKQSLTSAVFVAAQGQDGILPSQYGASKAAEGIAEMGVIYVVAQKNPYGDELKTMFKAQLAVISKLLGK